MAVSSVKLRTLYMMRILLEKTDESHPMSAADIGKALGEYGMSANRKTVYSDIETLIEFGMDILQAKGTNGAIMSAAGSLNCRSLSFLWTRCRHRNLSAGKNPGN